MSGCMRLLLTGEIISPLVFVHESRLDFLRQNSKVLMLDCTYKTDRYHFPLLQFVGTTALNQLYYAAFAFEIRDRGKLSVSHRGFGIFVSTPQY